MTRRIDIPKEIVKLIRAEYMPYVRSYGFLAKKYNCAESTIRDIVQYRTRKNVV